MTVEYRTGSGPIPTLSFEERDRRYREVRRLMADRDLDCLVVWGDSRHWDWGTANVRYLSQVGGNGEEGLVVFPLESPPVAIVSNHLLAPGWRAVQDWVEVEAVRPGEGYATPLRRALADRGVAAGDVGLVGTPPTDVDRQIRAALSAATVREADGIVESVRVEKSDEELAFIERAGAIADEALAALVDAAEPGATERDLVAVLYDVATRAGGEPPYMVMLNSGNPPLPHPHRQPTDRVLEPGDAVHVEFHPKYGGYVVHRARTVFLGPPDSERRAMIDVGREAFAAGAEAVEPGATVAEVERTVRTRILDSPYSYVDAKVHGHGLASSERPLGTGTARPPASVDETPTAPREVLRPGMVPAVNVNVATPDWSEGAAMFDDTFVVTDDGARRVGEFELGPVVKER